MKKPFPIVLLLLVIFFSSTQIIAQQNYADNVKKEISNSGEMIISYDIAGEAKYYNVVVGISSNNQKIKLNSIYGDYGSKISPGKGKTVVWYYESDFKGDINNVEISISALKENEPQAKFVIKSISNSSYAPCDVSFSNSSDHANDYEWDFGDPASGARNHSSEKEPSHRYEKPGTYTITLRATNTFLDIQHESIFSFTVLKHLVTLADFSFSTVNVLPPFEVIFTQNSQNADTYSWNFGDTESSPRKNTSTDANTSHKYKLPGTYTVSLTVANNFSGQSNTVSKEVNLVEPDPPVANFVFSSANDFAPAVVTFSNTSTNADSYSWDFGDPGSGDKNHSKDENPPHTYNTSGEFEVTLTATNELSGKAVYRTQVVEIADPPKPPEAAFTIENNNAIAPTTIIFNNNSLNSDSYIWDFGDPASGDENRANIKDPTHTYKQAGRFTVTMTSTNTLLNKNSIVSSEVIIREPAKPPLSQFTFEPEVLIAPVLVTFTNTSVNAESFNWNFGDPSSAEDNTSTSFNTSHTFSKPGTYKVTLSCTNTEFAESSDYSVDIIVAEAVKPPLAMFEMEFDKTIAPATIRFINTSTFSEDYSWDFGDPDSETENSSSEKNPTHVYSKAGIYKVVLVSGSSQTEEVSTHYESLTITEKVVPIADFNFDAGEAVVPVGVKFTNLSLKADSFEWDFGDPGSGTENTSIEVNPQHTYRSEGQYHVTLLAINESSGEKISITRDITVTKPILPPEADFTYTLNGDIAPVEVAFSNTSKNGDQFLWEFGDSSSQDNESNEMNPTHLYENPGIYTVTLNLTNSESGKVDVLTKKITIVSEYTTFAHVDGTAEFDETATSILSQGDDNYLILVSNSSSGSSLLRINGDGEILLKKDLSDHLFDLDFAVGGEAYVAAGFKDGGDLTIQNLTGDLELEEPVLIEGVDSLNLDYSVPRIAVSNNAEVGIVGNIIDSLDRPSDFWFQKLDTLGIPVPVKGKTFKFMGIKLENELIASEDGGFAITGFWQEDENKPKRLMFASVDSAGKGYLKAITAQSNFIGLDIVTSHTGGYGILAGQGSSVDELNYNLVFMIVDLDGGPMGFSGMLHGDLFFDELNKFPPCIIKTDGGYVVASHFHNGTDYDIILTWIDVDGRMIMKKEQISRAGNQFATDLLKTEDGSFIIIGAEQSGNDSDALIIKTDPFGKLLIEN